MSKLVMVVAFGPLFNWINCPSIKVGEKGSGNVPLWEIWKPSIIGFTSPWTFPWNLNSLLSVVPIFTNLVLSIFIVVVFPVHAKPLSELITPPFPLNVPPAWGGESIGLRSWVFGSQNKTEICCPCAAASDRCSWRYSPLPPVNWYSYWHSAPW